MSDLAYTCVVCGTTLEGPVGRFFHLFGITRSARNPNVCNRCNAHMQEGRIIELSVIFADLTGFTEMTNRLGAERSFQVVDAFFKMANEVLIKNDAFIDKYVGDAVMAIFNAPIQHTRHARQATLAATGIQEGIKSLAKEMKLDLRARIGVASGYARVGRVGSSDRKDYTAIGDVVNLASRLEAFANPGEIMIDRYAFAQLAEDYPDLVPEELNVRGFPEPVRAYRLGETDQTVGKAALEQEVDPLTRRQAFSLGAVLFAIFGAPCASMTILSPLAVAFGLGAFLGMLGPLMGALDSASIRIPLQVFAIIVAAINLYVIWYGNSRRRKSGGDEATRLERRKATFVVGLSIFSLLIVVFETYVHVFVGGKPLF